MNSEYTPIVVMRNDKPVIAYNCATCGFTISVHIPDKKGRHKPFYIQGTPCPNCLKHGN